MYFRSSNSSKVFPSAMLTVNAKLQGLPMENAQSQNFLWEWLVIVMFIIEQTKNILRVTSSFINNE